MKFGYKHYYEPTPKNIKRLATAFAAAGTTAAGYAFVTDHATLGTIAMGAVFFGTLISNFFSE